MQKRTTAIDLKDAIRQLDDQQSIEWALLKEQVLDTCESLKPVNIIKNTLKEVYSTIDLKTNIVKTIIGIIPGFVARKVLIGKTHNPITKLLGFVIEMFIANKVAKNADGIKSFGSSIMKKVINQDDSGNI